MTYSFGSRQGRAVLILQVARPGTFRVVATGAPTVAGGSDLAFGSGIADGIVGTALGAGLLMLLGVVGGITVFVIRLTAHRRAQLRMPPMQSQTEPPMGPPTASAGQAVDGPLPGPVGGA